MLRVHSVQHPYIQPFILNLLVKIPFNSNGAYESLPHELERLEDCRLLDGDGLFVVSECAYIFLDQLGEQQVYLFI